MKLTQILYRVYLVFFLLLSVFTILAPRPVLISLHAYLWSWVLLIPPVWWLYAFIRTLYRGGE